MVDEIINAPPRPSLLCYGVDPASEIVPAISALAPRVEFVMGQSELDEVRQAEWDAVVVVGDAPMAPSPQLESHLYVIQFGGLHCDLLRPADNWLWEVMADEESVGRQLLRPETGSDDLTRLVRTDLIPLVQLQRRNKVMRAVPRSWPSDVVPSEHLPTIHAFLKDGDGRPFAGKFIRDEGPEWWWLPLGLSDNSRWIAAALKVWSEIDPERFPAGPGWAERHEWQTPAEADAQARLAAIHTERERILCELEQQEAEAFAEVEEYRQKVDAAERRLLTAQGDELVSEVRVALDEIGFKVADADKETAMKGDRLEDLRVEDLDAPEWISLTEVRGYIGGAKLSDLQRIGRFVERYIRANGEPPTARWYIVNHHLREDPSSRPHPLAANSEDVEIFADGAGLIIDTRSLFKLRMQVRRGEIDAADIGRVLKETRGRYQETGDTPPPEPEGS